MTPDGEAADPRTIEPGEAWLVLRAQAGSRDHLEQVARLAHDFLKPRLAGFFDQAADAEDTLQDVLFQICRRLSSLDDARLFRPWAHRIAMRAAWRAASRLRRERQRTVAIEPESLGVAPESPRAEEIREHLDAVSAASRVVLTLHYVDGLTLDAVASELGVPLGTVKSRLAYGLGQLRRSVSSAGSLSPRSPTPDEAGVRPAR